MGNSIRNLILAVAVSGGLFAVEQAPASSGQAPDKSAEAKAAEAEVKAVMETIQSLSGVIEGLEATANAAVAEDAKTADKSDAAKAKRPAKNSIAIITAGAAAGASIGAATKKGTQAIVIGAIAGAAAGLIYDRMTANPKENAEPAPATESGVPAKAPESVPVAPKTK